MNNSSAVFISNIDDYLAPSQACVNPLYNNTTSNDGDEKPPAATTPATASVVVPRQRKKRPNVTTPAAKAVVPVVAKDPIKASMADCLACSGCVTTAETVLLEQQHSLAALKTAMTATATDLRVATISPAAWADMLRHLGISPSSSLVETWQRRLAASLQEILQVSYVLDGNIPLRWSLLESAEEFCRAYQHKQSTNNGNSPEADRIRQLEQGNTPSIALNSQETNYMLLDGTTQLIPNAAVAVVPPSLPILTSSCPALVCLAEKSAHGAVRHLSKTKSPMSWAGAWWRWQQPQRRCFHLAFMPCHDKKLEASRKDFFKKGTETQDVDMVLTTQEWFQMLEEYCRNRRNNELGSDGGFPTNSGEDPLNLVKTYLESIPPARLQHAAEPSKFLQQSDPVLNANATVTLLLAPNDAANEQEDAMELDDNDNKPEDMEIENSVAQGNGIGANASSFFTQGSGGLAEFVFRYAAWRLFDTRLDRVEWKPVVDSNTNKPGRVVSARMQRAAAKNRDHYQATLYQHPQGGFSPSPGDGSTPVLRFGIAYGLQTVQRVLEPFQQKRSTMGGNYNAYPSAEENYPFDFVEAMACPSGCLNGGGQLRVADRETPTQTRQRVALTKDLFVTSSVVAATAAFLPEAKGAGQLSPLPQAERQTRFHVVPPLQHSLGAAAGVAVKDTQW